MLQSQQAVVRSYGSSLPHRTNRILVEQLNNQQGLIIKE
jgi:hypothetical protein